MFDDRPLRRVSAHGKPAALKVSNLKTNARVVKLKLKNFLLDFFRAEGFQTSVNDHRGDSLDVGRRWTIAGEMRHGLANVRVDALQPR
jgi:hypothetical protein